MSQPDFAALRARMVREQIAARGITDEDVLRAMQTVPREAFVRPELMGLAYDDRPLPLIEGQTISQPYIVAVMVEAARIGPEARVLEVGAGSGYAAAILGSIAREVHAVERSEELARSARERLAALGYDRVVVHHGDGSRGLPAHAPYDAILVSAGGPSVPAELLEQLATQGRLVMPVGPSQETQQLALVVRGSHGESTREDLVPVQFVPLVGAGGWPNAAPPDPE